MQAVKQKIYSMVETMPDYQLDEIANFIAFIKTRSLSDSENTLTELARAKTERESGDFGISADEAILGLKQIIKEAKNGGI
ncbi:MAG: hypothetical protein FWB96_04515 [Defluviitaleaceae bacterium]|nr:hypothetical protein [Defluviitaleaceae bacterium]MCL2263736.1 hypothetical protein [Defluviitaleaceae bacterium]